MYKGVGFAIFRDRLTERINYQYSHSSKNSIWEGVLFGNFGRIDRGIFHEPVALICASGTIIDLRITTFSETHATFKGVTRQPELSSKDRRRWRPAFMETKAGASATRVGAR